MAANSEVLADLKKSGGTWIENIQDKEDVKGNH